MRFSCPTCAQVMEVPDAAAGRKAICPKCKQTIPIPILAAPVSPPIPMATLADAKPQESSQRKSSDPKWLDDWKRRTPWEKRKWIGLGVGIAICLLIGLCSIVVRSLWQSGQEDPTPTVKRMIEDQYKVRVKSITLVRKTERMYSGFAMMEDGFQIIVHEVYIDNGKVFARWEAPWINYPK